jgi:hypothetical protein
MTLVGLDFNAVKFVAEICDFPYGNGSRRPPPRTTDSMTNTIETSCLIGIRCSIPLLFQSRGRCCIVLGPGPVFRS